MAEYIVVHNHPVRPYVVQEIEANTAVEAISKKTEDGALYVKIGPPTTMEEVVDELEAEARHGL